MIRVRFGDIFGELEALAAWPSTDALRGDLALSLGIHEDHIKDAVALKIYDEAAPIVIPLSLFTSGFRFFSGDLALGVCDLVLSSPETASVNLKVQPLSETSMTPSQAYAWHHLRDAPGPVAGVAMAEPDGRPLSAVPSDKGRAGLHRPRPSAVEGAGRPLSANPNRNPSPPRRQPLVPEAVAEAAALTAREAAGLAAASRHPEVRRRSTCTPAPAAVALSQRGAASGSRAHGDELLPHGRSRRPGRVEGRGRPLSAKSRCGAAVTCVASFSKTIKPDCFLVSRSDKKTAGRETSGL